MSGSRGKARAKFRVGQVAIALEDGLPRKITKAASGMFHCEPGMELQFWFRPSQLRSLTAREIGPPRKGRR